MLFKEVRILDSEKLRNYCIRNNYYTAGDNEEYSNLLYYQKNNNIENLTTYDVFRLSNDIFEHSDITLCDSYTREDAIRIIMQDIINTCCITIIV